jgi:hypothetical protein
MKFNSKDTSPDLFFSAASVVKKPLCSFVSLVAKKISVVKKSFGSIVVKLVSLISPHHLDVFNSVFIIDFTFCHETQGRIKTKRVGLRTETDGSGTK